MRKLFVALALALVLLVPGTPAPSRAGTFEFEISGPVLLLAETDAALEEVLAIACLGTSGATVPWIAVTTDSEGAVDQGYVGAPATLRDRADKFKATFKAKAKQAASEDIRRIDEDASTDPDTGIAEGVKATMKGKAQYVVDPETPPDLAGTSGKVKVKDKTNKQKLSINANIAAKVDQSCTVEFDTEGKAVSVRVGSVEPGALTRRLGR